MSSVIRFMARTLVVVVSLFTFSALAQSENQIVNHVDLRKYQGQWYEIASIPQSFQRQCVKDTTAVYSAAEKGLLRVINSCTQANGKRSISEGRAMVADPETNAKLYVTFVKFIDWIFAFGGDYWIIDLGANYEYAVVGSPYKNYSWILARDQKFALKKQQMRRIERGLKAKGYDTCKMLLSVQTGSVSQRTPLCQYVR